MNSYVVIMAGGVGTRLWPLSRRETPKQSHKLLSERTMFQETVDRITPMFKRDKIFVVTVRNKPIFYLNKSQTYHPRTLS